MLQAKAHTQKLKKELEEEQARNHEEYHQYETFLKTRNLQNIQVNMKQRRMKKIGSMVYSVAWSNDSSMVASSAKGGTLNLWRPRENKSIGEIMVPHQYPMCCAFNPSGRLIVIGMNADCSVYIVNEAICDESESIQPNNVWRYMRNHTTFIFECEFFNDYQLLSCSGDHTCILWDVEMGKSIQYFNEHSLDCTSISKSPIDGNLFISGACDMNACLCDLRIGKCVQEFKHIHTDEINSVKFLPNGMGFATGSEDLSCKIFDLRVENSNPLMTFSNAKFDEAVHCVSFSQSGRILFSCQGDFLLAWDSLTGNLVSEIDKFSAKCSKLSVAPDGSALAACSWDETVRIYA